MRIEFEVSAVIPATPGDIYKAWLNSDEHSRMTGSRAEVSNFVGGTFEAWDGYIQGRNLILEPETRILQSWRTTEFNVKDEDSQLEILLELHAEGALVTIRHFNLPAHGMKYQQGWVDAYFNPMKDYFSKR